jgi:hypothetical protein
MAHSVSNQFLAAAIREKSASDARIRPPNDNPYSIVYQRASPAHLSVVCDWEMTIDLASGCAFHNECGCALDPAASCRNACLCGKPT